MLKTHRYIGNIEDRYIGVLSDTFYCNFCRDIAYLSLYRGNRYIEDRCIGVPLYTVKNVPVFVPVFLYAVTMLIFPINRIISSEKWFNYVVTFLFFEDAKNLGWSDATKRRKKRGWPYDPWRHTFFQLLTWTSLGNPVNTNENHTNVCKFLQLYRAISLLTKDLSLSNLAVLLISRRSFQWCRQIFTTGLYKKLKNRKNVYYVPYKPHTLIMHNMFRLYSY